MKTLAKVFPAAFVLNAVWENMHAPLYVHYQGGSITEWILLRAALWDAIIIVALALLAVFFEKNKNSLSFRARREISSVIMITGV